MMQQNLTEWDEDIVSTPEEDYQTFLRGLSWRDGFGIEFVRCSPALGQDLIEKVKHDLPQKKIDVLTLSEPIENLIEIVQNLPNQSQIDILFVVGLEKSLTDYIRTGYGGQGDYYNLDTVPPILSHLNWQRENFRDRFPNLCFVFLLPNFAIKYIIRRAPDFYDWASGKTDIPSSQELVTQESWRILLEGDYQKYLKWTPQQRKERILEINELLLDVEQTPDRKAFLLFEQGNIFHANNQYEEAINLYDKAVAINPDFSQSWSNRGTVLGSLGRYEEAIVSHDKALQINPNDYYNWYNRGVSAGKLRRYEEAIAAYDRAIGIKSDYYEAWLNRGDALFNLGRHEEAMASFDRAIAIKPDYYEAWLNRGDALFNLGRHEEAMASFDRAIAIKPDYYQAWFNRGISLVNLGRYKEALLSYDQVLQIYPDLLQAWNNRGTVLFNLGRYEEAINSFDLTLQIKPDFHDAWYNKACAYSLQNAIDLALENLQKAIQINPEKCRQMAKTDSDFDNIRHDPRFQALLQ